MGGPFASGSMQVASAPWLPFYHPTRVLFVDDRPATLRYQVQDLAARCPVGVYDSASELLRDLDRGRVRTQFGPDCFSDYTDLLADAEMEQVIGMDKTMIVKHLFDAERFATPGVMVIDYAMPDLDGPTLCRRLEAHARRFGYTPAKRIMLTARADATLAMEAVNAGLIAAFHRKDDPDLGHRLPAQIARLQHAYIAEATNGLRDLLARDEPAPYASPAFQHWFATLCAERGIVEYYAVFGPGRGYLLLDADGAASLLLLFSLRELSSQYEAARTAGAPEDVLARLHARTHAIYLSDEQGSRVMGPSAWRRALVQIAPFADRQDHFYARTDDCGPHGLGLERITSLKQALTLAAVRDGPR